MKPAHKYNYAVTGNCSYLAYVKDDSSLEWMCWPQMDSSFVFGALIDEEKGGSFKVIPQTKFSSTQKYIENTPIIVTTFQCEDGEFEIIDFAPRFVNFNRSHKPLQFFRKIRKIRGFPKITIVCEPRGDYGKSTPTIIISSNHINYSNLHTPLRLTTNASKTYIVEQRAFVLTEDLYLVLSGESFEAPLKETLEEFYYKTVETWRKWVKETYIPNIFQKELIRSAITIKIHQFEDTGAIIASGTTSLPEDPGSGRNWDYRYCWLRDSYFSLAALNSLGHFEEAEKYLNFVQNILVDIKKIQPIYKINGESQILENEMDLDGYLGNKPVRVGNAAFDQKQFDSYGQVILSLLPLYTDERIIHQSNSMDLKPIYDLLNEILAVMDLPDAGIWELRGRKERHLGSYIFHWAGAKAAKRIAIYFDDQKLWQKADTVEILAGKNIEKCYCNINKCYMADQTLNHYDATGFLLITMNYLDSTAEKTKTFFQKLQLELLTEEGMIYRYRTPDDFGNTNATFLICTYWYIESLICIGDLKEASFILKKIISHANHVGLLSEDLVSKDGSQWGNFPQTYSHVGLINAVCRLARKKDLMVFE